MSGTPDAGEIRRQLFEENQRLAQRCLELESTLRRQSEKLRTANAMLGHSEVDLRALLNSADVGFALLDIDHRVAGANQALADLLRTPMEDLLGMNFVNFVYVGKLQNFTRIATPPPDVATPDKTMQAKREDIIDLVSRDGSLTPCRIVVNDWRDPERGLCGSFLLVFDSGPELQAAKRLGDMEVSLKEAEKTRALFLEVVSRELRTPAAGVVGMSRMLLDAGLDERQSELAGVIHSSAGSLVRLVDDLVSAASPDSSDGRPRPTPMSPASLARGVANLFAVRAEEKGLNLVVETSENVPPRVMGDPKLIRRILAHLMDNSVKFTDRGRVTLSVDVVGQSLRFMVTDTGPGIDQTGRKSMYSTGHTRDTAVIRRRGGIGVGLSICRRLAGVLGGRLECESEPGRGTEFHFTIPLVQALGSSDTGLIRPPAEAMHLPPQSILLADDNPMSSQMIMAYLAFDGHRLTHTDNGVDAAEKCRTNHYDLVILDKNLPKLDGMQTLRLIRGEEKERSAPKIPVLLMVPKDQIRQGEQFRHLGADGVVAKPVNPVELMSAVASATGVSPVSVALSRTPSDYSAEAVGSAIRRLDGSQLANLSQVIPKDQFQGLLRFFMEDGAPDLYDLRERILKPNPDRERIAFAAAKIRGLSRYLGFTALADLLEKVENGCRHGAPSEELCELAGEIEVTLEDSLAELKRVLPEAFATISGRRA